MTEICKKFCKKSQFKAFLCKGCEILGLAQGLDVTTLINKVSTPNLLN